jgi:peroxiredoxin
MKLRLTFLHLIVLFFVTVSFVNAAPKQSLTPIMSRPLAPEFKMLDMDDVSHKLSEYKGKPVIVNFWATWCPPCRAELPSMNRAWKKVKDEGIEMLAINVGEDEDSIFIFTGEYPIDFTVLLDESGAEIRHWPIKGLPTTFVLDPEGRIVYQAIGSREWDDDALLDKVRALKK